MDSRGWRDNWVRYDNGGRVGEDRASVSTSERGVRNRSLWDWSCWRVVRRVIRWSINDLFTHCVRWGCVDRDRPRQSLETWLSLVYIMGSYQGQGRSGRREGVVRELWCGRVRALQEQDARE